MTNETVIIFQMWTEFINIYESGLKALSVIPAYAGMTLFRVDSIILTPWYSVFSLGNPVKNKFINE